MSCSQCLSVRIRKVSTVIWSNQTPPPPFRPLPLPYTHLRNHLRSAPVAPCLDSKLCNMSSEPRKAETVSSTHYWTTMVHKTAHSLSGPSVSTNRIIKNWRMKTYLYNFDPLKPHLCIVKLGFTGVYIIFLISAQKHRQGKAVLMSTHNLCFEQKYEKISEFLSENFHCLVVKFSVYLNRLVFVMRMNRSPANVLIRLWECKDICLFCFCILCSNIYPKINCKAKTALTYTVRTFEQQTDIV